MDLPEHPWPVSLRTFLGGQILCTNVPWFLLILMSAVIIPQDVEPRSSPLVIEFRAPLLHFPVGHPHRRHGKVEYAARSLDFGCGHVTCFSQWNFSDRSESWDLNSFGTVELSRSLEMHSENRLWSKEEESHVEWRRGPQHSQQPRAGTQSLESSSAQWFGHCLVDHEPKDDCFQSPCLWAMSCPALPWP